MACGTPFKNASGDPIYVGIVTTFTCCQAEVGNQTRAAGVAGKLLAHRANEATQVQRLLLAQDLLNKNF